MPRSHLRALALETLPLQTVPEEGVCRATMCGGLRSTRRPHRALVGDEWEGGLQATADEEREVIIEMMNDVEVLCPACAATTSAQSLG